MSQYSNSSNGTNTVAPRHISYKLFQQLREYATPEYHETLDQHSDASILGAMAWCERHDRTSRTERFIMLGANGQPVGYDDQRTMGTIYFECLKEFRDALELVLAVRTARVILTSPTPKPVTDARRAIPEAIYSAVQRLGRAERFRDEELTVYTKDECVHLYRYLQAVDKQGTQELVFLDADGKPQPQTVQKLFGWRFFNYLNQIKKAIELQIMIRTLAES